MISVMQIQIIIKFGTAKSKSIKRPEIPPTRVYLRHSKKLDAKITITFKIHKGLGA